MEDRIRDLEKLTARLEERDRAREKAFDSMSGRLWAVLAVVLFYVMNQLLGIMQVGSIGL